MSTLFNWWVIFSASLWSLRGPPVLPANKIRCSVSVDSLASSGCFATIDLSNALPFFEVDVTATGMVFSFRRTVVYCYTRSVLAPDATTVAILGLLSGCECVRFGMGAGAERRDCVVHRGCGVGFPAAYCLRFCLFTAAAITAESEISRRGVAVLEGVHEGVVFAANVLRTSLVKYVTCP